MWCPFSFWIPENILASLLHNINYVCCISGEKLTDEQVDDIIRLTDLQEDLEGNVKYEGKSITKSHND